MTTRIGAALFVAAVACLPVGRAQDVCEDMVGWLDSAGDRCSDYVSQEWCVEGEERDPEYFKDWANEDGVSAGEACCVCGRGRTTTTTSTTTTTASRPSDSEDGCEDLVILDICPTCSRTEECSYVVTNDLCANGEASYHANGPARQACCACGGGRTTSTTSTTTTMTTTTMTTTTTSTTTTTTTSTAKDRGAQKSPSSRARDVFLIVMVSNLGIGLVMAVVVWCVRSRSVKKNPVRFGSEGSAAVVVEISGQVDAELGGNPVVLGVTSAMATPTPK